jgi:hypothetical protein
MHGERLAEQRAQVGCSLLHLTFEAAQESHEARSFSFFSLPDKNAFCAEVSEDMIAVGLGLSKMTVDCH